MCRPQLQCRTCLDRLQPAPLVCSKCFLSDCNSAICKSLDGLDFLWALYGSTGHTAAVLRNWKKHARWPLPAPWTSRLSALPRPPAEYTHVLGVPTRARRHVALRGHWVARIARQVARIWNLSLLEMESAESEWVLAQPQAMLSGTGRHERQLPAWNWPALKGDAHKIRGVVLVDDFVTTGRTLHHVRESFASQHARACAGDAKTRKTALLWGAVCVGLRPPQIHN